MIILKSNAKILYDFWLETGSNSRRGDEKNGSREFIY